MSILQDHIKLLKTAVAANNWSSEKVINATDLQIKNVLSLTTLQAEELKPWISKLRTILEPWLKDRENNEIIQSILTRLTPEQKQWFKSVDPAWLIDKINPPQEPEVVA